MKIRKIKTGDYTERRKFAKIRLFVSFPGKLLDYGEVKKILVPKVFKRLRIRPNTKVKFSRYAGCSCGCSPGLILDAHPLTLGYEAIWVTIY